MDLFYFFKWYFAFHCIGKMLLTSIKDVNTNRLEQLNFHFLGNTVRELEGKNTSKGTKQFGISFLQISKYDKRLKLVRFWQQCTIVSITSSTENKTENRKH